MKCQAICAQICTIISVELCSFISDLYIGSFHAITHCVRCALQKPNTANMAIMSQKQLSICLGLSLCPETMDHYLAIYIPYCRLKNKVHIESVVLCIYNEGN